MSITSMQYIICCVSLVVLFYIIPKRFQWCLLLIASLLFYSMTGIKNIIYILITSFSTYFATGKMEELKEKEKNWIKENRKTTTKEERSAYKKTITGQRKKWMIGTLVLNFGIMCFFKYIHFVIAQINAVANIWGSEGIHDTLQFIIPLGISFYTFQTMGYLVDVYWEKAHAEKNYAKVLLFVSFFPQMTQGPISNYNDLTSELFKDHYYSYERFSWGAQRIIWGYFKKVVVASIMFTYVDETFHHYHEYIGIAALMGAFCYSIQIYADFSGYMDIVCGLCEIMDIRLTENFERPYFSKSIAEYWRRWHSSLGAWFKNYIYYPIAMSKWNRNLGKVAKKKLGKTFGETVPASIALVAVWLTTGLWHGASWAYIAWGGVNGLFIIFSLWMEPVYENWKSRLHINSSCWQWRAFQTIRTFFLVTLIKVLPEVGTLAAGLGLWARIFTQHSIPHKFHDLLPFVHDGILFAVVCIGTLLIFIADLIQRKQPVRKWMEYKVPYLLRICIYAGFVILIGCFSFKLSGVASNFLYAQF